jgi:flagellar biosynthesis repressor protein FlbT
MTTSLRLSLKAGEKIFINGAVLKVDRKVSLELLNDAQFLLAHHVITAERATTPLRQLYFVIQTMLMSPTTAASARPIYRNSMRALAEAFESHDVLGALVQVSRHIDDDRPYEALKVLRKVFPVEAKILGGVVDAGPSQPGFSTSATPTQELVTCN